MVISLSRLVQLFIALKCETFLIYSPIPVPLTSPSGDHLATSGVCKLTSRDWQTSGPVLYARKSDCAVYFSSAVWI